MSIPWRLATLAGESDIALANSINQRVWFASLLRLRGIETTEEAEAFLKADLNDLPDPFLLPDMEQGVERLCAALRHQERIAVYGDYDADGVSATALMVRVLIACGFEIPLTYIPDRFDEGYGMKIEALEHLINEGAQLILTVDCGVSSFDEANFLREQGVDLIITDHHQAEEHLPYAVAVINPARRDSAYPAPILAGVGVAYEVARALGMRLAKPGIIKDMTVYAAVGSVADNMELKGSNRILVSDGLRVLSRMKHCGFSAIMKHAGISGEITASQLAFSIVPRINAGGRMQHADLALHLMLCEDEEDAAELVAELDQLNDMRKQVEQEVFNEALTQYENASREEQQAAVQVFFSPDWHPGVLGIVASRLVERLHCPVLVAFLNEDGVKGSGRVPEGSNLFKLLQDASDLLTSFGGHRLAAGFTCNMELLPKLRERLSDLQKNTPPISKELRASLEMPVGMDLPSIFRSMKLLEPFGNGNEEPLWLLRGAKVVSSSIMGKGEHLSATIDYNGMNFNLIAWRKAEQLALFQGMTDVVVRLFRNVYRGQETIRLELIEWRPVRIDNLELINKIRAGDRNAVYYYSMEESFCALMESGCLSPESKNIPLPRYSKAAPFLPETLMISLGSRKEPCCLLDPLFSAKPLNSMCRLLASDMQKHTWEQKLMWLLPDISRLRSLYRWLRQFEGMLYSEIPWPDNPWTLQAADARHAAKNAVAVFCDAGLCSLSEEGSDAKLLFSNPSEQVQMESVGLYIEQQQLRRELLSWI